MLLQTVLSTDISIKLMNTESLRTHHHGIIETHKNTAQ